MTVPLTGSRGLATTLLVVVTAIWGATFPVVKDAVGRMPVLDFLALRFLLATAVMVALRPRSPARLGRTGWCHGLLLGLALGAAYVVQTYGLRYTSPSVSGFITGMFLVFTPLIAGVALRRPVDRRAWLAVGFATVGLALLSLRGSAMGIGELLTLAGAILFAVHIVGLGEWSPRYDPYPLAIVQLATVGVMCLVAAAPGGITPPPDPVAWFDLLACALLATVFAFLVQTWAQARMSATRAAVVLTMEPVFAGLFGVLLAGDRLTPRTLAGAACVLGAMYLVELGPRHGADAKVERLEA
ncbi:EamA family transporter [Carbonactinospora thermoautotrophica]|uniref:DMT family transporter n=1 Tax=Carbonactinospora thermoautotrophica TaxID=1469144 RepID=UPI00226D5D37|nr:DMT family transporter [Carbonactinospora thermoautotrophica]MCX9190809.1 EamA family transporter [Carbonactinospora thermoautotrophica]